VSVSRSLFRRQIGSLYPRCQQSTGSKQPSNLKSGAKISVEPVRTPYSKAAKRCVAAGFALYLGYDWDEVTGDDDLRLATE
jgi:hypothetical protein